MSKAPPAEIQALIDAHVEGFNTQNSELFLSVFGNTAVIIDGIAPYGIAPYRWLNPNAAAARGSVRRLHHVIDRSARYIARFFREELMVICRAVEARAKSISKRDPSTTLTADQESRL